MRILFELRFFFLLLLSSSIFLSLLLATNNLIFSTTPITRLSAVTVTECRRHAMELKWCHTPQFQTFLSRGHGTRLFLSNRKRLGQVEGWRGQGFLRLDFFLPWCYKLPETIIWRCLGGVAAELQLEI